MECPRVSPYELKHLLAEQRPIDSESFLALVCYMPLDIGSGADANRALSRAQRSAATSRAVKSTVLLLRFKRGANCV